MKFAWVQYVARARARVWLCVARIWRRRRRYAAIWALVYACAWLARSYVYGGEGAPRDRAYRGARA